MDFFLLVFSSSIAILFLAIFEFVYCYINYITNNYNMYSLIFNLFIHLGPLRVPP